MKFMKDRVLFFFVFIIMGTLFTGCSPSPDPEDDGDPDDLILLELSEDITFQVIITVTVTNDTAIGLTRISVFIPVPRDNVYQEVSNVNINDATLLDIENSDCKYARFEKTADFPGIGESYECSISYNVTLHRLYADTAAIETIYSYDTQSTDYTWYQGNRGGSTPYYIDIENPDIISIGDTLWTQAGGSISEYAQLCYEHVAMNYNYVNPYSGLHTISDIMDAGGGDCGITSSRESGSISKSFSIDAVELKR